MRYSTHYNKVLNAARERGATLTTELTTYETGQHWIVLCEDDQLAGGKTPLIFAHGVQVTETVDRIAAVLLCRTHGIQVHVVAENREEAIKMTIRMIEKGYGLKLASRKPDIEGEERAMAAVARMKAL